MVVYRKRHQDWTLPRGKVKDGESFQEAAMREVQDETGCSCRIGNYLGTISYSDNGVPKVVLFWKMTLVEDKGARNNDEIGEAFGCRCLPQLSGCPTRRKKRCSPASEVFQNNLNCRLNLVSRQAS